MADWFKIDNENNTIKFVGTCNDLILTHFMIQYKNYIEMITNKIELEFDITECKLISIEHLIKFALYLNTLKSLHKKKLNSFKIKVNNSGIKHLIYILFVLSPPVVEYEIIMV